MHRQINIAQKSGAKIGYPHGGGYGSSHSVLQPHPTSVITEITSDPKGGGRSAGPYLRQTDRQTGRQTDPLACYNWLWLSQSRGGQQLTALTASAGNLVYSYTRLSALLGNR